MYFTSCILHNTLLLDVLEASVDWGGADGRVDGSVGPIPELVTTSGVDDSAGTVQVDIAFEAFRNALIYHFLYKAVPL